MSRIPTSRMPWLPGVVLLAIAAVASLAVGRSLGVRGWTFPLGFAAGLLLLIGALERVWGGRAAPRPPRARGKLKVLQGGKAAPYDLEKDNSTDNQRYLM